MIFRICLLLFTINIFASTEYKGEIQLTSNSIEDKGAWQGFELTTDIDYLFNEKKDDFGILISPPSKVTLDFDIFYNQFQKSSNGSFRGNEIGLTYYLSPNFSFFIGDRILIWGRADKLNPTDIWNAEDLEFLYLRDKTDRKIARTMLILSWKESNQSLDFIISPNDIRSRSTLPSKSSSWCNLHCQTFNYYNLKNKLDEYYIESEIEKVETKNFDIGLRYNKVFKQFDTSFMFYHGQERYPLYSYELKNSSEMTFKPLSESSTSLGADLSFTTYGFTLLGEAKYQIKKPFLVNPSVNNILEDNDGIIYSDEGSYTIGADYTLPFDIYFNLQYFDRYILDKPENLYDFGEGQTTSILLRKSLFTDFELEFNRISDLDNGDSSDRTKLKYKHSDELNIDCNYTEIKSSSQKSIFSGLTNVQILSANLYYSF